MTENKNIDTATQVYEARVQAENREFLVNKMQQLARSPRIAIDAYGEEWAGDLAKSALELLAEYDGVLRGLAFYLAAGGFNSEGLIDPKVADSKIRDGIDALPKSVLAA